MWSRSITCRRRAAAAAQAVLLLGIAALVGGCGRAPVPPGSLQVSFLDLGEAECVILQTSDAACLIDAGEVDSAPAILRALKRRGIRRIDLAVLTHPHSDHIGGMRGVGEAVPVGAVLDCAFPAGSSAQRGVLEWVRSSGTVYRRARAGQKVRLGDDVWMDVLWPGEQFLRGTESDANNNSVVLMLRHGAVRMLFTGDLQREGEMAVLEHTRGTLKADLLKVGHQGSCDATSEDFLQAVSPGTAVISVGRRNTYGHPCDEIVERIQHRRAKVLRTDQDGDVVVQSDGRSPRVVAPASR